MLTYVLRQVNLPAALITSRFGEMEPVSANAFGTFFSDIAESYVAVRVERKFAIVTEKLTKAVKFFVGAVLATRAATTLRA